MKSLILLLVGGIVANAADPPIVNVIGVTEFEVPATDPAKEVEILPPIALVFANDMKPETNGSISMRVKLAAVSVGTTARPEYGRAFEFGSFAAGKKGEVRELTVKVKLTEIPDPQTYLVKVLLLRDGDASVALQAIDLKFTRPAATLSVSPPRLDNRRFFPFSGVSSLSPDQLKLQETSRRATLTGVQLQLKDYLKGPDDSSVPAQLQVPLIDKIDAGSESTTKLNFNGYLPLGSTKGTLVVRSRQLTQPLEVAIEIVTRTSRFWLLAALALSILLGYFFRTIPEKRRVENQSRIVAEREFGLIKDLVNKAIDPDLKTKLGDILQTLRSAIDAKPFDAATLGAEVKKAGDDADTQMKAAETAREALRTRIKELRVKLGSPEGQPVALAQAVRDRIGRLTEQDSQLKSGAVASVSTALDTIESEIQNDIPKTIALWAQDLRSALEQIGQWQGLDFEAARKQVLGGTDPATIMDLNLTKTRDLAREAEIFVLVGGQHQVIVIAGEVLDSLERLTLPDLKPKLDAGRQSLNAVRELRDLTINGVGDVGQALGNLRSALIAGIESAATIKNVARPEGLDQGDFRNAMSKLSASIQLKERPLGAVAVPQAMVPLQRSAELGSPLSAATAAQPKAGWWDLQLSAPMNPTAGEQAVATAEIIGNSPGAVDFEWVIGNSITSFASGTQAFTPAQAGALAISVRAVARGTGEVQTTSAVIQVRGSHGFEAASRLAEQLARDEIMQTIVSGFFIAAAGYAIFQANWFGTFMDFLAAMLWGFSIDVSVAKLRDFAGPVLGRAVPLPAAKP